MDFLEELVMASQRCPYDYPIDIETKEVDKYGYFEAILGRDGQVYEAIGGHTGAMRSIIARERNISWEKVDDMADTLYYQEWLLEHSGAILLWHKFAMTVNITPEQEVTLNRLKEIGHLHPAAGIRVTKSATEFREFFRKEGLLK